MSAFSLKTLAITAAIGIGTMLGANAASAAPVAPAAIVANHGSASSLVIKVDHRRGHYDRYDHGYRPVRACSVNLALNKASRMGLRNPRAVVNRNVVRVTGWRYGHRTAIVFARAPGCPVIR
ncbi:antifreeze protein [Phyllobacterium sp. 628]|uniref:antifreeze protein n=1 Tax=Phyllobacterium sp. 628 TaxID=2718938 RepID=UPI00166283FA|nr:antifreeze protein [Phyllobacterium sp. 628]QND53735.1 antifreeze protein [Phyllobacterium sp. 628]